jgi:uncharacterized membrane protein YeaQ/YmgE (transglycosylase-associated protein family)
MIPYWLYFILIGLLAGWLAGRIMKGRGFGLVGNLVVGVVGAWLGNFLFGLLEISLFSGPYSTLDLIVRATVGAIVLLYAVSLIKKR